MLSLYGKTDPPDHAPSFCDPSNTPILTHPNLQGLMEPILAPVACRHHVPRVPCLPLPM